MRYIKYETMKADSKDIPDGEIFVVYTDEQSSPFIKTEEKPAVWAFAMKMKGEITSSDWGRHNDDESVKPLMKQILYAKKNGWSGTGEKRIDENGEMLPVYRCIYCGEQTQEVLGPCNCRSRIIT